MPTDARRPHPLRPSALWYLAGLPPLTFGIAASVLIGGMAGVAPEPVATFHTCERAEVELAEEGLTVLLGKGWKAGVSVRCSVHDADGEPVPLTYGITSQEVTSQGTKWHPAYETSDPQPPGRYTVGCELTATTSRWPWHLSGSAARRTLRHAPVRRVPGRTRGLGDRDGDRLVLRQRSRRHGHTTGAHPQLWSLCDLRNSVVAKVDFRGRAG